jgi:hypothetical protein
VAACSEGLSPSRYPFQNEHESFIVKARGVDRELLPTAAETDRQFNDRACRRRPRCRNFRTGRRFSAAVRSAARESEMRLTAHVVRCGRASASVMAFCLRPWHCLSQILRSETRKRTPRIAGRRFA